MTNDLATAIAALNKRDCKLLHEWTSASAERMHEYHYHWAARVIEALEASLDATV